MYTNLHTSSTYSSRNFNQLSLFCKSNTSEYVKSLSCFEKRQAMEIIANEHLSWNNGSALKVFMFLLSKANNDTGICWHSNNTIAKYTNLEIRVVKRATKKLHDLMLITKTERFELRNGKPNHQLSNVYEINYGLITEVEKEKNTPVTSHSRGVTPVDTQTTTKAVKSNSNTQVTNKNVKKRSWVDNPNREINVDDYFPTSTAYDFLNQEVPQSAWDMFLPEVRAAIKAKESELGRKLLQREANHLLFPCLIQTKRLRALHGKNYIPFAKRYAYNEANGRNLYKRLEKQATEEALKTFSKEEMDYYNSLPKRREDWQRSETNCNTRPDVITYDEVRALVDDSNDVNYNTVN